MKLDQRIKRLEQALRPPESGKLNLIMLDDGADCPHRKPECPADHWPQCTRNRNCWSRLAGDEIMYIGLKPQDF